MVISRQCSRALCAAQGLDKGILFCTYSLLLQKSVSTKQMNLQQKANPDAFHNKGAGSLAEGKAFREAAIGTVEFGEPSCHFMQATCNNLDMPVHAASHEVPGRP